MARRAALAVAMVALLGAAPIRAEDTGHHVSFRWEAPSECPDDGQALAAVVDLLGQPLSEAREQELAITVNVRPVASGFSATLVFVSPQGTQERILEHASCEKLTEGAALLAALAIDPERVRARQAAIEAAKGAPLDAVPKPPPPCVPPPASAQPACPRTSPPSTPAPSPRKPGWQPTLGVAGLVGAGVLPGARPGLATDLGLRFDRFQARLVARYWFPGSADIQEGPLSIELSLATVGLHGCTTGRPKDWSLLACLGVNVGDMSGSGQGLNHARTRHALSGAAEVGLLAAYSRVKPAPFAGLGLSLALLRPRFGASLAGVETETFKVSQAAVIGYLGMSYGL